jgi:hypothetical protein
MIINLIDSRSGTLRSEAWGASAPRRHVARIVAGALESLDNILRRVIQESEGPRSIWLLRIMAHGDHGYVQLGGSGLDRNTSSEFAVLRDYFTPGGIGIALHSCGPASHTSMCRNPEGWLEELTTGKHQCIAVQGQLIAGGGSGVEFLTGLARVARVPVRGGINLQMPDAHFSYEGPSIAVSPSGALVAVPDWGSLALDTTRLLRSDA